MISYANIESAHKKLSSYLITTPLIRAYPLEDYFGLTSPLYLKCENLQITGSFKARGAFFALLNLSSSKGVATRSTGNFGRAVAYGAHLLSLPATVVLPKSLPLVKKEAIEKYSSEVIFCSSREEEEAVVKLIAQEKGYELLSPYDHENVITGQATLGYEILQQNPSFSHYICPIGGGGVMAATSLVCKEYGSSIETIGVEPEGANDYALSRISGEKIRLSRVNTIADGLRAPTVGLLTYPLLNKYVDHLYSIPDSLIQEALALLFHKMGLIVEPSAAISIAPFLQGFSPRGAVISLLSGGNVDLPSFFKWIEEFSKTENTFALK